MDAPYEDLEDAPDLPIRPAEDDLAELTPRQQKIERAASVYFEGCRQVARGIRQIKAWLDEEDG